MTMEDEIVRITGDLEPAGRELLRLQACAVDYGVKMMEPGKIAYAARALVSSLKDYGLVANKRTAADPFDVLLESLLERPPLPEST